MAFLSEGLRQYSFIPKLLAGIRARDVVIFRFLAAPAVSVQAFQNPSDSLIELEARILSSKSRLHTATGKTPEFWI